MTTNPSIAKSSTKFLLIGDPLWCVVPPAQDIISNQRSGFLYDHILQRIAAFNRPFRPLVIDADEFVEPLGQTDKFVADQSRKIGPEFV